MGSVARSRLPLALLMLCLASGEASFGAATIEVVVQDGASEGLNDPGSWTPRDGNPATTLGEARLAAVRFAASLWAAQISSDVAIRVGVSFDPLGAGESPGVLGLGGPEHMFRDFAGAPRPETWYPSALADRLAGMDLAPGDVDLYLQFNSDVDGPVMFGDDGFDYGFDPDVPVGNAWFVEVALHELAHGLGFTTLLDFGSGAKLLGKDDTYLVHLIREGATPERLTEMSDSQRLAAIRSGGGLQWDGLGAVDVAGLELTAGVTARGNIEMHSPTVASALTSASHFSNTVAPPQLLSVFYSEDPLELELARAVIEDLGWGEAPACAPVSVP